MMQKSSKQLAQMKKKEQRQVMLVLSKQNDADSFSLRVSLSTAKLNIRPFDTIKVFLVMHLLN